MVWLISFLTVGNIALGYGLAIYVQRQFGTLKPSCGPLRSKMSEATAVPESVVEVTKVQSPVVADINKANAPKKQEAKPAETRATPSGGLAEEASGLPSMDEENVLAGIEEFRSQLAKMNVSVDENAEAATEQVEDLAIAK
jgi:hypothetical protein